MNYSLSNLRRKDEELSTRTVFAQRRIFSTFLRALFVLFLALAVIGACGTAGIISGCIASAPDVSEINISPSGFATFIYDSEGNQLQKLTSSNSNRTAVSIKNVPAALQHAVVAIEDERFYQHNGIDPKGILRAIFVGVKNRFRFSEGASTITQQLLKNNVFVGWTQERSLIERLKRKFQEQYLAVRLEEKLKNKDLILENYLNTINLGAGTYGVQAAAKKYFNKDVWELDLSECTVLAGITQNPSRYNPIRHPENNAERRERVLKKMLEQGYITEEEMDEALADNVYERIEEAQLAAAEVDTVYSYFIDALTEEVVSDLQTKLGYSETQAYQLLYSGGLRIYTTQDRKIQKICDEEYSDPANFPEETRYSLDWALSVTDSDGETKNYSKEMLRQWKNETDPEFDLTFASEDEGVETVELYKKEILNTTDTIIAERCSFSPEPQSSLVIMDQFTGYVKAIEGGRGKKTASLTLNRATDTYRQPGSTFKILSTYATAFESGAKDLTSTVLDEPWTYSSGDKVRNSHSEYRGWITLREAIVHSINTAAVKTIQEITPYAAYEQLLKFGITSLDPVKDVVEPLALGGISKGVSNLELSAAYAAIANGGTYIKPIFYSKILDQKGEVLLDNIPEHSQAVSPWTAAALTSAMEDVVKEGTATEVALESGMAVAGKTGTTNDYRNLWFVGYTPYYTMGIWLGNDNNDPMPDDELSKTYHKKLWNKIMTRISATQYIAGFKFTSGSVLAEVCEKTGLLLGDGCTGILREFYSQSLIPTENCTECGIVEPEEEPEAEEEYTYVETEDYFTFQEEETYNYDTAGETDAPAYNDTGYQFADDGETYYYGDTDGYYEYDEDIGGDYNTGLDINEVDFAEGNDDAFFFFE